MSFPGPREGGTASTTNIVFLIDFDNIPKDVDAELAGIYYSWAEKNPRCRRNLRELVHNSRMSHFFTLPACAHNLFGSRRHLHFSFRGEP